MDVRVYHIFLLPFLFGMALLCSGCGDDASPANAKGKKSIKPGTSSVEARKRSKNKKGTGLLEKKKDHGAAIGVAQLKETDFIKAPRRRDPFEPFIDLLTTQEESRKLIQRNVKLKEYDVSDLKLIGIITNIGDPRAMVVVPDGTGFVLKRGDYVGRADYVQQPGTRGEQIQVNWRVARIHGSGKDEERGVFLIRDDPTTTKGVDVTRFLSLHPTH